MAFHLIPLIERARRLTFAEDRIGVTLDLSFQKAVSVTGLFEQIPYLIKEDTQVRFKGTAGWEGSIPDQTCAVFIGTPAGDGLRIEFPSPVSLSQGPVSHWKRHRLGLLQIDLGSSHPSGITAGLDYTLLPVSGLHIPPKAKTEASPPIK